MARRRHKGEERVLALERMRKLLRLAEARPGALSDRYVRLARRIGMRYQVPLPPEARRRICRACDALLVPGRTARVRLYAGRMIVTCLRCSTVKRYPYTKAAAVTA